MKKVLEKILKILATLTIRRYKPKVVGITGNVGKTSTKDAVFVVLSSQFDTRKTEKSFNNEIGFPLTILGFKSYGKNIFGWAYVIIFSILGLIYQRYPKILVLEYGADKPGDIEYLLQIVKPHIAVVTAVGDVPVHVENFPNKKALLKEKSNLVKVLGLNDFAILGSDDEAVLQMQNKTKGKVFSFGFSEGADLKIFEPEERYDESGEVVIPEGISFKVEYDGKVVPVRLDKIFGKQSAYAAGVASLVGSILDINLVQSSEALSEYKNPPGRLSFIEGINQTFLLDDTYNAAPLATEAAIKTLKSLKAKRKVVVLGDMLELGEYSEESHKEAGKLAASFCDLLLTVGDKTIFTDDAAKKEGLEPENIHHFDSSDVLKEKIKDFIQRGDLVLVKGSQGMRMEKVVKSLMAHPEDAEKLLVRQNKEWLKKL